MHLSIKFQFGHLIEDNIDNRSIFSFTFLRNSSMGFLQLHAKICQFWLWVYIVKILKSQIKKNCVDKKSSKGPFCIHLGVTFQKIHSLRSSISQGLWWPPCHMCGVKSLRYILHLKNKQHSRDSSSNMPTTTEALLKKS